MWQKNNKLEGKVAYMLGEGCNLSKIAKAVNLSPAAILKRARKLVEKGKLEKVARGVYRKKETVDFTPPTSHLPSLPPPIMMPAKFGGIWAQVGKPRLKYDMYGKAREKTSLYSAQFGKCKTQIWLLGGFNGTTIKEQIINGHAQLESIAADLAKKHNITLTLLRWYEDVEWVDPDTKRSAGTAKGIGLRRGERVRVAGALHKYSDFSHPEQVQFNALPGGDKKMSTNHAVIREAIYSGEYERRFEMLMTLHEKVVKEIAALTEIAHEIKLRMDMEAKK